MNKIFLNRNVSYLTKPADLKQAHLFFRDAIVLHTISLVVKDIEKNPELIEYIKKNNIDVQVSCWTPFDTDYKRCFPAVQKIFGEEPDRVYPFSFDWPATLKDYCESDGLINNNVIGFECWKYDDVLLLEPALKIYNKRR